MRFLEAGRQAGQPPLLLIHGLLGYSFSWRFNVAELARERQVLAVDLPGVGFSERSNALDCCMGCIAGRLHEFLRDRGEQEFDLLGTSHGGGVAILLAAMARETAPRIRRLVLSAPVNPWSPHGRVITRLLATRVGAGVFRCCEPLIKSTHDFALRRMYGNPSRIVPGTLEGYREPLSVPGTLEHVLRIVKSWHKDLAEVEAALGKISDVPTLLLWGARDDAVLPRSAEKLRAKFRNAELVVFGDAGHLPYEEVPEQFNRAVGEFLRRL